VTDTSKFGVSVKFETLPTSESGGLFSTMKWLLGEKKKEESADGEEAWSKHTALFPAKSQVPSKTKTVAFHYDKDIMCRLEYDVDEANPLPEGTHPVIGVYNITGVAEFAKETVEKGLGEPKVHLSFVLDASGMVVLARAEATVDLPVDPEPIKEGEGGITAEGTAAGTDSDSDKTEAAPDADEDAKSASSNEEGVADKESAAEESEGSESGANSESESESDKKEEEEVKDESTKDNKKKSSSSSSKKDKKKKDSKSKDKDAKEKKQKKEKKDTVLRRTLKVNVNYDAVLPPQWSPALLKLSRERMSELDAIDAAIRARAAALNDLEAYVLAIRNRLRDEEGDDQLGECSNDQPVVAILL
jgi:hypothetical protein